MYSYTAADTRTVVPTTLLTANCCCCCSRTRETIPPAADTALGAAHACRNFFILFLLLPEHRTPAGHVSFQSQFSVCPQWPQKGQMSEETHQAKGKTRALSRMYARAECTKLKPSSVVPIRGYLQGLSRDMTRPGGRVRRYVEIPPVE